MKAWTTGTVFLFMALCWGCDQVTPGRDTPSGTGPLAEYRFGGKIVLGSPSLTAGLPGSGPLTRDQIRNWLEDPEVHRVLDFVLPLGLRDAADLVRIPSENPLTRAKIELGRQLFFDTRLSEYSDFACATCHIPEQHYSASTVMPESDRNPSVCFNRLFSERQFWDGRAKSLEDQPESPISNIFEMNTTPEKCVVRLQSIEGYQLQFDAIFGRLDMEAVGFALACFQRALVTGPAPPGTITDCWLNSRGKSLIRFRKKSNSWLSNYELEPLRILCHSQQSAANRCFSASRAVQLVP